MKLYGLKSANTSDEPAWFTTEAQALEFVTACGLTKRVADEFGDETEEPLTAEDLDTTDTADLEEGEEKYIAPVTSKSTLTIRVEATTKKEDVFTLSLEVLDVAGPHCFDENDGASLTALLPAFADLAREMKIETNGKNDAWLSTWDSENLLKLAGKTITVEYSEVAEIIDGEESYVSCDAKRISMR